MATQMEGKAGVLESEIKMDKGRGASTEKKEEEEVNSPVGLGDKLLQAQEQQEELPQTPEEVIVDNIEETDNKDFVDPFNNLY